MSLDCFFFNDTATTEIYTLSLHDALPICARVRVAAERNGAAAEHLGVGRELDVDLEPDRRLVDVGRSLGRTHRDRKSTRLNSSHANISYAVFCLKKKIYIYILEY